MTGDDSDENKASSSARRSKNQNGNSKKKKKSNSTTKKKKNMNNMNNSSDPLQDDMSLVKVKEKHRQETQTTQEILALTGSDDDDDDTGSRVRGSNNNNNNNHDLAAIKQKYRNPNSRTTGNNNTTNANTNNQNNPNMPQEQQQEQQQEEEFAIRPGAYRVTGIRSSAAIRREREEDDESSLFSQEEDDEQQPQQQGENIGNDEGNIMTAAVTRANRNMAQSTEPFDPEFDHNQDEEQARRKKKKKKEKKRRRSDNDKGDNDEDGIDPFWIGVALIVLIFLVGIVVVIVVLLNSGNDNGGGTKTLGGNGGNEGTGGVDGSDCTNIFDNIFANSQTDLSMIDKCPYLRIFALEYGFDRSECAASDDDKVAELEMECAQGGNIVILDGHKRYKENGVPFQTRSGVDFCQQLGSSRAKCTFQNASSLVESAVFLVACASTFDGDGLNVDASLKQPESNACSTNRTTGASSVISQSAAIARYCPDDRGFEFGTVTRSCDVSEDVGLTESNTTVPFCGIGASCGMEGTTSDSCSISDSITLSTFSSLGESCLFTPTEGTPFANRFDTTSMWEQLSSQLIIPRFAQNSHIIIANATDRIVTNRRLRRLGRSAWQQSPSKFNHLWRNERIAWDRGDDRR